LNATFDWWPNILLKPVILVGEFSHIEQ